MKSALSSYLLSLSPLTALAGQRITWKRRDQGGGLPAIVLHTIDNAPVYHVKGRSGLVAGRVQADCWGATFKAAEQLGDALKAAIPDETFIHAGTRFSILVLDDDDDSFDESGTALYRVRVDLAVFHAPAV